MDSLIIDTPSSAFTGVDHISSFLEAFQDKNSHLFPSNELAFEVPTLETCEQAHVPGLKRKRDSLYDSFSSWTEDLLSGHSDSTLGLCVDNELLECMKESSVGSPSIASQKESHEVQPAKKRKMEQDDELALFTSEDARSSSPPFQVLDFELDSVPEEPLTPIRPVPQAPAPAVLTTILETAHQIDDSVRSSLFESFSRLAQKAEQGPVATPKNLSPLDRIEASQDLLTMHTAFGMALRPPTLVKPEPNPNNFYPVSSSMPYVVANPFMVPPGVPMAYPETVPFAGHPRAPPMYPSNIGSVHVL